MPLQDIARVADGISARYGLCDQCLGRLFAKKLRLSSNRRLGKRLNKSQAPRCYICRGLFASSGRLVDAMLKSAEGASYSSFSVGVMVKPSIMDRDDEVRSKYKLRGVDGVKADLARELAKAFAKKTGRRPDQVDSDITLTVDSRDGTCEARTRPVIVTGTYTKSRRGLPQRRPECAECGGAGCKACGGSIEGLASGLLHGRLGGTGARFTWVGGEDAQSLVNGRPFYARIQNPRRRKCGRFSAEAGGVVFEGVRTVPALPPAPVRFESEIIITVTSDRDLGAGGLGGLRSLAGTVTIYERSGRRAVREVRSVRYRRLGDREFRMRIVAEGGVPVKRLVNGDEVVPSVSSILGCGCVAGRFDFVRVTPERARLPARHSPARGTRA